jgi:hypothetical protein
VDVLAELGRIASVFGMAFVSLWGAAPLGLALGLHPLAIIFSSACSYACGAGLVLFAGEPFRRWLYRRLGHRLPGPDSRTRQVLNRYGSWGLGALAPLTLGAQLGALLGLLANMPRMKLFLALALGGLAWSCVFTGLFVVGVATVQRAGP